MGEVKPVAWLHHTCLRGGQVKAHVTFSPENPLTEFLQTQQREEFQATSESLYPASAISVLQAEIEKLRTEGQVQFHEAQRHYAARRAAEAPAARLQAERDGDVAKAVAAEREARADGVKTSAGDIVRALHEHFGTSNTTVFSAREAGRQAGAVVLRALTAPDHGDVASQGDEAPFPPTDEIVRDAVRAMTLLDDWTNVNETNFTGWGDGVVPPGAEFMRAKSGQAMKALNEIVLLRARAAQRALKEGREDGV